MPFDHIIALVSASMSFIGLVFVGIQLRDANRQRESDSQAKVYDINRQLLALAFEHPQLFFVLNDNKGADPVWEKHYLQLWFNQFSQIHTSMQQSIFKGELRESLIRDMTEFMAQKNMQAHWRTYARAYPVSFQKFVDEIMKQNEPPKGGSHEG